MPTPREFKLPGIQDLSKDQEAARMLPKAGQHLIIGGPGTGKSVLALLRSRRHQQANEDYVFLVYNRLLNEASRQLSGTQLRSKTWHSWFRDIFRAATGTNAPQLPLNGQTFKPFDWDRVLKIIDGLPSGMKSRPPFLIIDEGQDMPPEFYRALIGFGFENFYVVADQNQQIISGKNSTRQDIQNALGIEPRDVIELRDNYRNNLPIARLAREFYTGDPASPPPQLPDRPSPIRPQHLTYKPDSFQKIIENILKMADNNPAKLIGIIAPNNNVRRRYFNALQNAPVQLDHGQPSVRTYWYGASAELPFNEGGIMVINVQSCKGLEFDTVFLADINKHYCPHQHQDQTKRNFYVMVARAKERVIMLQEADRHCPVDSILPQDPEIMEREEWH